MIKLICAHQDIDPVFECVSIDEAVKYLSEQTVLGVDTETSGKCFTSKKVVMFQIGTKEVQYVIDTRFIGIEPLIPILENPNIVKIFHNIKFDYKFLKAQWGSDIKNPYDTMLAEGVINCGKLKVGYSLNALTQRYLGKELNKEVRNKFVGLDGNPFNTEQILYGAEDVEHLLDIRTLQLAKIKELELEKVLDLENNAALAFADIEFNGLEFDSESWLAIAEDTEVIVKVMETELDKMVYALELSRFIKTSFQTDMFIEPDLIRKIDIKWSSPTQVLQVFREYGLDIDKVNAFELSRHKNRAFVTKYLGYKEKQKVVSTYGKSFLKYVMKDGKVRTSFWQILNTGRVSSGMKSDNKPNMQNIPADNKFRNCFKARDGYKLVSVDYSGQELGIIASGSKDPVWMKAREEEADLHSICADMVFKEKWREADADEKKKLRTMIKTINFGLAYGMSKFKLSDTLQISVDDAEALIEQYFTEFPKIGGFLNNLGNYGKHYGFIRTFSPFRRIRWFENWHNGMSPRKDFKELGAIERASKNTPIQGTGADMIKLAMIMIRDRIDTLNYPAYLVTQVHDEIGVEVREDKAEEWAEIQSELMRQAGAAIIPDFPMGVDYTISKEWCK
tara:strand:- start:9504 stop:11360 length:1857 start_codon:yes stop_codon:yes gene_type:complete